MRKRAVVITHASYFPPLPFCPTCGKLPVSRLRHADRSIHPYEDDPRPWVVMPGKRFVNEEWGKRDHDDDDDEANR
ncbi:uncharacterized protein LY79DRAFT_553593 [Colletotrichum navitas]|uniref:Uncharacterized protein n=1 Tax=Colletotrichum navitas TaxID=681940 RepID=A0AAD8Q0C2_9PEZI|nr:uncharacterized protein LY79DRAFT_553593 [Colletotrichum navitas]KAK1590918.1 hypothetical protein LY79DRAFT_553593 [Colletotrichum navitas]